MPIAMRYTKPEVQDRIARDYVIGSLSLAARRRCEMLRRELPELDKRIYRWQEHLQPLADVVPERAPRALVWEQLEASINAPSGKLSVSNATADSWWNQLSFLRTLAIASSFLVVALVLLRVTQVAPPQVDYVAVLADDGGQPVYVATASETTKALEIRNFTDVAAADTQTAHQLWALSKTDGEARSLGLLDAVAVSQYPLSEAEWRLVMDAEELLVTAEMPGGSAIGEPSDEVISRGLCVRLSTG